MGKTAWFWLLGAALMAALPLAHAFDINPLESTEALAQRLKPVYRKWLERVKHPVHEQLTLAVFRCAQSQDTPIRSCVLDSDLDAPRSADEARTLEALLRGVHWNDDPNNFFVNHQPELWAFWMLAAENDRQIDKTTALQFRSHYGDLQFLHTMASPGEARATTHQRLGEWLRFAADVALGRVAPSTTLGELKTRYAFAVNFAGTSKEQWSVERLFFNFADHKKAFSSSASAEEVRLVATGALLHTLEDSFAHGHTLRMGLSGDIEAFMDYGRQDPNCHGGFDHFQDWMATGLHSQHPFFTQGAELLRLLLGRGPEGTDPGALLASLFQLAPEPVPDRPTCLR